MSAPIIKLPDEATLTLMVQEEEIIRNSPEYAKACTAVKDTVNGWLDVTADIQHQIVQKYGFTDEISCDIAINMLRTAHHLYPDNPVMQNRIQARHNKARIGILNVGDTVPDVVLYNSDAQTVHLHDILTDRSCLIIGGSQT